ncbi:MAG: hypothetical protein KAR33_01305 [Candidatus Thorarchaeota archaeon]|nr:hypothetical protein [Candidatus Thorarchaeota archaeon]
MFGKSLYRLMKYGIIVCVAIIVGSTLLATVSEYVSIMREGNYVPLIMLLIASTVLVFASERYKIQSKVADILVKALSALLSILLFMVVFLWLYLPLGLVQAAVVTCGTILYLNIVRRPSIIREYWESITLMSAGLGPLTPTNRAKLTHRIVKEFSVVVLQAGQFDAVIELFRNRPHLPMILIHYEEMDVLYIRQNGHSATIDSLLALLDIMETHRVSPLLSRFIVSLPVLEEEHGVQLKDYRLVEDQIVVDKLLESRPVRMSVIPHTEGPRLVVLSKDTLGMNVMEVPSEHLVRVVLGKDLTPFQLSEEVTPIAG